MRNKESKLLVGTDRKTEVFKKNIAAEIAIVQFRNDIEQLNEIVKENRSNMKWLNTLVDCCGGFSDDIINSLAGYNFCSEAMGNLCNKYSNWFKNNIAVYEASEYENKELRERVSELSLICSKSQDVVDGLEKDNSKLLESRESLLNQIANLNSELEQNKRDLQDSLFAKGCVEKELLDVTNAKGCLEKELKELMDNSLTELDSKVGKVLKLFSDNMASMLTSEFMKSDVYKNECASRKGENSPRYRQDAPDEEIVNYFENGLTVQELATMYNMTENGIREKLKRAGKWENRRKKSK